ncbi:hypothetical protein LAZ67_7001159 [Cordylochernes scorpioides]|uniref:Uncharacterized protein n=1 Tax=Cordylochernes scorpioides TaxID=51811 RepID=A0ABY6KM20_9ARAC|nr:hypothetical protein LAZ67_7001159 [Cordylochernes scorpioides]
MDEHHRNIRNSEPRSLIVQHIRQTAHSFDTSQPQAYYSGITNKYRSYSIINNLKCFSFPNFPKIEEALVIWIKHSEYSFDSTSYDRNVNFFSVKFGFNDFLANTGCFAKFQEQTKIDGSPDRCQSRVADTCRKAILPGPLPSPFLVQKSCLNRTPRSNSHFSVPVSSPSACRRLSPTHRRCKTVRKLLDLHLCSWLAFYLFKELSFNCVASFCVWTFPSFPLCLDHDCLYPVRTVKDPTRCREVRENSPPLTVPRGYYRFDPRLPQLIARVDEVLQQANQNLNALLQLVDRIPNHRQDPTQYYIYIFVTKNKVVDWLESCGFSARSREVYALVDTCLRHFRGFDFLGIALLYL